jgi:hypothetical protein
MIAARADGRCDRIYPAAVGTRPSNARLRQFATCCKFHVRLPRRLGRSGQAGRNEQADWSAHQTAADTGNRWITLAGKDSAADQAERHPNQDLNQEHGLNSELETRNSERRWQMATRNTISFLSASLCLCGSLPSVLSALRLCGELPSLTRSHTFPKTAPACGSRIRDAHSGRRSRAFPDRPAFQTARSSDRAAFRPRPSRH